MEGTAGVSGMKILSDGINKLRLCQLYSSITEALNLYAQEVTYVALVIDGEAVGAGTQVRDNSVGRSSIRAKDNAVVDVDQEDD